MAFWNTAICLFFFIYTTHALSYIHERAYARLNCVVSPGGVCRLDWLHLLWRCCRCPKWRNRERAKQPSRVWQRLPADLRASTVGIAPLPLALEEFTDWLLSRGFSFAKFNGVDCTTFERLHYVEELLHCDLLPAFVYCTYNVQRLVYVFDGIYTE